MGWGILNRVILAFALLLAFSMETLFACTEADLTKLKNDIDTKLNGKFSAVFYRGTTGIFAVLPKLKLESNKELLPEVEKVMSEFGTKSGDGWKLKLQCDEKMDSILLEVLKPCEGGVVALPNKEFLDFVKKFAEANSDWKVEITATKKSDEVKGTIKLFQKEKEITDKAELDKIQWKSDGEPAGVGSIIDFKSNQAKVKIAAAYLDQAHHQIEVEDVKPSDLQLTTKIIFNAKGEEICRLSIKYKDQEITKESTDDAAKAILRSLALTEVDGFKVECTDLDCQSEEGKFGGLHKILISYNDQTASATCSFDEPKWDEAKLVMKGESTDKGATCKGTVLVKLGEQGVFQINDTIPGWLGKSDWKSDQAASCTGLNCNANDSSFSADLTVTIKEKELKEKCEVKGKASTEVVDDDFDLSLDDPAPLILDPKKGGRRIEFKAPFTLPPPDLGFRIMPGLM